MHLAAAPSPYAQGHHLAVFGRPLFDDTISAWDMGQVVGTLWKAEHDDYRPDHTADLSEGELNTVGYVLSRYGALTGTDLENLSHSEPPWQMANRNRRPGESARIEPEWMADYFRAAAVDDDGPALDTAELKAWLATTVQSRGPGKVDDLDALRARIRPRA